MNPSESLARRALGAMVVLLCSACSSLPAAWRDSEPRPVDVMQVGAAEDCGTPDAGARVALFATGEALREWAAQRNRLRLAAQAQPGRPYAVVELGTDSGARGLAVAREGQLQAGRLRLSGSVFRAGGAAPAPCVLLGLPSAEGIRVEAVDLYDSAGTLIAGSDADAR